MNFIKSIDRNENATRADINHARDIGHTINRISNDTEWSYGNEMFLHRMTKALAELCLLCVTMYMPAE